MENTRTVKRGLFLLILSYIAFISLGLPDGLHGVAWPGIRETFGLPIDAIALVMICGTVGYSLSGFFSGVTVRLLGVGGLLALSCTLTSLAELTYGLTRWWPLFVGAATVGGLGAGAIDAGVNNYVEKHYSERLMQWLHASFGIGITAGPIIMTMGIQLTGRWRIGYLTVCGFQAVMALLFFLTRNLWERQDAGETAAEEEASAGSDASMGETLKVAGAWLSMVLFFLYVGAEIGLGLWVYSLLTGSRGVDPAVAGFVTSSYWGMFTLGRFTAGWYTRKLTPRNLLYFSIGLALTGTVILTLFRGVVGSVAGIGLVGFAIAPIFPALMSDTEKRVGRKHVANTIGMQISASGIGGAAVPSLAGVLARVFGLEVISPYMMTIFLLLLICLFLARAEK